MDHKQSPWHNYVIPTRSIRWLPISHTLFTTKVKRGEEETEITASDTYAMASKNELEVENRFESNNIDSGQCPPGSPSVLVSDLPGHRN